jgi:hypothetical protein
MRDREPEAREVLGARALNRALLARQMLLRRETLPAHEALERLVGLQAQSPLPPYTGLWTRLDRFDPGELARLLAERGAVRIALMRSTIHLVTAADALRLRPVVQPVITRAVQGGYGRLLAGLDEAALAAAGRALVEERPRTFAELGLLLAERWPDRGPAALANAVRALVPLVQVPPRGLWGASGPAAHTSVEAWLGRPLDDGPSVDDLLLRYLAAFGPATVADAQAWSGLTRLAAVAERLRPRLRAFRDERGRELLDLPDAPRPGPDAPAPPRFLPEWDNALLSFADRTRIVAEAHRARLFSTNGVIPGTVLVDGFVRATWRIGRARGVATLRVEPFARLARRDRAAVAEEGERLLAFAAGEASAHEVRFAEA